MSEGIQKPLTDGEHLIGSFNPDGRKDVEELKACAARMIDILCENSKEPHGPAYPQVAEAAKMQILSAQMMAVKSLFV